MIYIRNSIIIIFCVLIFTLPHFNIYSSSYPSSGTIKDNNYEKLNKTFGIDTNNIIVERDKIWEKRIGFSQDSYSFGVSIIQTPGDNGYSFVGSCQSYDYEKAWIVKTDNNGSVEWNCTYDEASFALDVLHLNGSGFILFGQADDFDDYWLLKTDENGTAEWNKTYSFSDRDMPSSFAQSNDNGFALIGTTSSPTGKMCAWLVKTDENGTAEWNHTYSSSENNYARSILQTTDGGYAIVGYEHSLNGGSDFWLLKTDEKGFVEWNQTYSSRKMDEALSIIQTPDNGFALAGNTANVNEDSDGWLIKTDEFGIIEWNLTLGGLNSDFINSLIINDEGDLVLAGSTQKYKYEDLDIWLLKVDISGQLIWSLSFGSIEDDWIHDVQQTKNGDYIIVGFSFLSDDNSCALLIWIDGTIDPSPPEVTLESLQSNSDVGMEEEINLIIKESESTIDTILYAWNNVPPKESLPLPPEGPWVVFTPQVPGNFYLIIFTNNTDGFYSYFIFNFNVIDTQITETSSTSNLTSTTSPNGTQEKTVSIKAILVLITMMILVYRRKHTK